MSCGSSQSIDDVQLVGSWFNAHERLTTYNHIGTWTLLVILDVNLLRGVGGWLLVAMSPFRSALRITDCIH